jgi:hypothetical protein
MITDKTKYLADKANESCSSTKVCYDYAQKLIELTIQECVEAIRSTDLRNVTYTTFDLDKMSYCKSQIEKNVLKELTHGNITYK